MTPQRPTPSPNWDAHSEVHAVDRYDRGQLALLDRIRDTAHPLVVFPTTLRVYLTEPAPDLPHHLHDTLALFLRNDLIRPDRRIQVLDLDGQPRPADVLSLTSRGRDICTLADRIAARKERDRR